MTTISFQDSLDHKQRKKTGIVSQGKYCSDTLFCLVLRLADYTVNQGLCIYASHRKKSSVSYLYTIL